jgi:thymidylate kinase
MSCFGVFAAVGMKDPVEIEVLGDIYEAVGWTPDIVVYIRTTPQACMERIIKRGRTEETNIDIEYLDKIHKKYEQVYSNQDTIVVDGEAGLEAVYQSVKAVVAAYATQLLVSK